MGKRMWLAVALGGLVTANALAGEGRTEMQITPFAGYSHLRIDGPNLVDGETIRVDQAMWGATAGFLTPFGVVLEIGTAKAFHEDIFENDEDFGLDTDFAAVGRTPVLTDRHLMTCTSTSRRYDWRLNPQGNHLPNPKNCPTARGHL